MSDQQELDCGHIVHGRTVRMDKLKECEEALRGVEGLYDATLLMHCSIISQPRTPTMTDHITDEMARAAYTTYNAAFDEDVHLNEYGVLREALTAALAAAPTVDIDCPHCDVGFVQTDDPYSDEPCDVCQTRGRVRALLLGPATS